MTRKALGRGLSALIQEPEEPFAAAPAPEPADTIPVNLIDPNPFQPRTHFAPEELGELAQSIRAKGVIQPVLLRRSGDRYQLVAGERRWKAEPMSCGQRSSSIFQSATFTVSPSGGEPKGGWSLSQRRCWIRC